MSHLTEETLNEYLDHALSPAARAEADVHLAACAACATELESLRTLFAAITSVPEAALERNLAPTVVSRLGVVRAGVPQPVWWALAAQGLVTLVILASLLPLVDFSALTLPPIPLTWPTLPPMPDISSLFILPSLSSLHFNPSTLLLVLLIVSAGLLWLVGNGLLLLLPRTASLKRRSL